MVVGRTAGVVLRSGWAPLVVCRTAGTAGVAPRSGWAHV